MRNGATHYGGLARWNVFTPWGLAGLLLFLIAATAESNRSPFDLPEGESEIIAGFLTEYSGFKYALFFLGEYLGLFAMTGLAVTLFLGGWLAPFRWLEWVPSWLWFGAKFGALIFLFIWVRATLPRLRLDQLPQFLLAIPGAVDLGQPAGGGGLVLDERLDIRSLGAGFAGCCARPSLRSPTTGWAGPCAANCRRPPIHLC